MNRNFDQLTGKWQSLGKLGQEAEQYVLSDPSVALFKLRLFAENMTDEILRLEGINPLELDNQVDKLSKLEKEQRLPEKILKLFHDIRKAGNRAVHAGEGTVNEASMLLGQASRLGSWFTERYIQNNSSKEQRMMGNKQLYTLPIFKRAIEVIIRLFLNHGIEFVINAVIVFLITYYLSGVHVDSLSTVFWVTFWLWIINRSLSVIFGDYGLVINIILFWQLSLFVDGFDIEGLVPVILGGFIYTMGFTFARRFLSR